MAAPDPSLLSRLQSSAASAVAIEALWDGDTQGWFVELCAVFEADGGYESRLIHTFSGGGDIRVFRGEVPPWPEALEAARVGAQLATVLGVPFHFPSPDHPEDECPHWWQLSQSDPCRRCGIPLLQAPECPWRGVCHACHCALEREEREARWSPEQRSAPRCWICGTPVLEGVDVPVRCVSCRERYRTFACSECGMQVTARRDGPTGDTCSSCIIRRRLSLVPSADRRRLREAAANNRIAVLIEIRERLKCGLDEAQDALALLSGSSGADE